ncbi:hypothetical protein GTH32_05395 [Alteromonas sp. 345S023]|uniref:Uncharacterized protein n=1 Tax=Alteromonas profundi TaxID=2696062 RepID=A0A7X5RKD9_9ALTE|nr:hypothetical protein [Alteromonas profundi]NDV90631.1 hypothetical protein [Alteromonas profundi]
MLTVPDFRQASFIPRVENPFRLTPPRHQAIFVHEQEPTQTHANEEESPPESISFHELIAALKNAAKQKQNQGFALLDLINAELMLVKKAFVVTAASALIAFALGIFCWILINAIIGYITFMVGAPVLAVLIGLLVFNIIAVLIVLKQGQSAFQYLNAKRMIHLFKQLMD